MGAESNKVVYDLDSSNIIDTDNYRGGGGGGIKDIILTQYKKAVVELSKEMTTGGIVRRIINNEPVEITAPNQIEIFINSVEGLYIFLVAKLSDADEDIKIQINKAKGEIEKLEKLNDEDEEKIKQYFKVKTTPHLSDEEKSRYRLGLNQSLNALMEEYEKKKVKAYKNLLMALTFLMSANNYFEEASL